MIFSRNHLRLSLTPWRRSILFKVLVFLSLSVTFSLLIWLPYLDTWNFDIPGLKPLSTITVLPRSLISWIHVPSRLTDQDRTSNSGFNHPLGWAFHSNRNWYLGTSIQTSRFAPDRSSSAKFSRNFELAYCFSNISVRIISPRKIIKAIFGNLAVGWHLFKLSTFLIKIFWHDRFALPNVSLMELSET